MTSPDRAQASGEYATAVVWAGPPRAGAHVFISLIDQRARASLAEYRFNSASSLAAAVGGRTPLVTMSRFSSFLPVIWNLLSNAIKFTPGGGRVDVFIESANRQMELRVVDTGRGIAPDFLPHVFERFRQAEDATTRRHTGLGLGLGIVRQLVELHGGTVHAASPGVGHGATFTVRLPIAAGTDRP